MPYVVGVIPARFGSQRLPGKPLVDLLGKPMVQRVVEQARKATRLDRVIVATEDERVVECVHRFGGEVVMTSAEARSGSDRVAEVAQMVPGDIFVNIQGDEPLITPEMIDEAVAVVLNDPEAQVGTLARPISSLADIMNPSVVKVVVGADSYALYFSRSAIPFVRDEADLAKWLDNQTFLKHIGIYVFRKEFLGEFSRLPESLLERSERLEQLRILENGFRIKVGITRYDSVPVDTKEDVEKVQALISHG